MSSKGDLEILDKITSKFDIGYKVQRERRIWLDVSTEGFVNFCKWLKEQGFEHLSAISAVDWPDKGKCELAYHLWSYQDKVLITLKVKIDRQNAVMDSVTEVWDGSAQVHEREIHELFGVNFEGNDNLTPLFLEDWEGLPPFRKDFDWREYVGEKYYDRQNERERVYYD
ncbi:MAG: NADH-quinone oxidoreductase subunit C [Dehalococcoidia bacterium]